MPSSPLSRIPMLRILVPFILGIITHRLWHCWWAPVTLICLSIINYLLLSHGTKSSSERLRWRRYFIIPLAMAAFALGWISANLHCPPHLTMEQRNGRVLTGRVIELQYTDFSMRMMIDLLDSDLPPCRVMVSTRGCDYTMQPGDLVAWQATLDEINSLGNPEEMNYASYLLDRHDIRYQQHLSLNKLKHVGHSPTLSTRMATVRRNLSMKVFNSRLSPGAQRFVSALLLGVGNAIDQSTRQEFSTAGIAHVLALSGLHVGFIALIIWWLLFPLDHMKLRRVRLLITLAAIMLFAVFTGLSPSVVRATVMIGCVFASMLFNRPSASLNSLVLAALVILVFSPSSLYSVGFQLSFITVAAVLLFGRLSASLKSRHPWVNTVSSTVITSLVAMLATVALSAHYFHTVSLMSVLSNLLVLPVLPIFMVLGTLFLLVTMAGMHWNLLDTATDGIYRYIRWATTTVNSIPGSHVGNVYVSATGVVIYFIILGLVLLWLYRRSYRYLLGAGCALVALLAHSLWVDINTPHQGLVIFNDYSSTPLLYYSDHKAYLWTPDDEDCDLDDVSRYHSGFLARHAINQLVNVPVDTVLHLNDALFKPPYALLMGHRFLAVGSGKWKQATASVRLPVDDIIVTKRYHGTAAKLRELYQFDRLIISGAMYDAVPLLRECDSLSITYHDLSSGAVIIEKSDP